jgi:SAM-dependent methyltransferase
VIRRMKLGPSALILEPWALSKRKPPPAAANWSPFVGARTEDRPIYTNWSIRQMRRHNRALNGLALATLAVTPKDHVLEIGYGTGDALAEVAKMARSGFAAGIDRSMEMLQIGWQRSKKAKAKNLCVLRGDVSWMPWSACSFDKMFCVDGITEWPCTRSGLEEAFRVLRPGGILVLAEHITPKFTKARALALAHLLAVVGFQDLDVHLAPNGRSEVLILRAVRS